MGNNGKNDRIYFLGFTNHCRWWLQPWNEIKRCLLAPWKKSYGKPRQHIKNHRLALLHLVKAMVFTVVMYICESWTVKKGSIEELMLSNCGVGEDSWESLGRQWDKTSQSERKSALSIFWKDWCWSWSSNTLWCKELTHWKRPWCWERLRAGEGGDREWDGWMASLTHWIWIWANSRSWWWTGRPGVLQSLGSKSVRHDWVTELSWADLHLI